MRWLPLLPTSLVVTTIVVSLSYTPSLTQSQVAETAKATTVYIQAAGRPDVFGSGVIVARSGNTYTALVAKHVVALEDTYKVTTSDKAEHAVKQLDRLTNIDIAVVQFESKNSYSVAAVGSPAQQLEQLFVSGYPKPTSSVTTIALTLVPATVNTILEAKEASEGFSLRYSATLRRGMSGGPVFNSSAQLVAIHGRADELGGLGIPLGVFQEQAKSNGLKIRLGGGEVAIAPPPPRPQPQRTPPPSPAPGSNQGQTVAANPDSTSGGTSAPLGGGSIRFSQADLGRLKDTKVCPNCSLDGAMLSYAHLPGAILVSASLRRSTMNSVTMLGADLTGANLSNAILTRADLSGARLQQADLSGANLSGANLMNAQLEGANLSGAILSGAILTGANLNGAKLDGAIGLPGKK
jgi:hypothetical protein